MSFGLQQDIRTLVDRASDKLSMALIERSQSVEAKLLNDALGLLTEAVGLARAHPGPWPDKAVAAHAARRLCDECSRNLHCGMSAQEFAALILPRLEETLRACAAANDGSGASKTRL